MMYACGQTRFMISCRTNSLEADVLMLNPARSSSRAMVAVPPVFTEAVLLALVVGLDEPELLQAASRIAPMPTIVTAAIHLRLRLMQVSHSFGRSQAASTQYRGVTKP